MKLKKGEIVIYAISLMLVAAGYFNYMTFEQQTEETYSEDVQSINEEYANVGDAVLVSNNESGDENQNQTNINTTQDNVVESDIVVNINDTQKEDSVSEDETEQTNSAIDEKSTKSNDEENYYASSKLDRDKMYAEMISSYEGILNNPNVSEAQKSIATQEISKINDAKNAIMICENLILTKGFDNCIIFINDKTVNVVVNCKAGLETSSVAKIQNIISRELNTEIENIHITER